MTNFSDSKNISSDLIIGRVFTEDQKQFLINHFNEEVHVTDYTIAKQFLKKFGDIWKYTTLRRKIGRFRKKLKNNVKKNPIKILFFDIETGYHIVRSWRIGYNLSLTPDNIIDTKKIICISYKWKDEDKVHTLTWDKNQNEKQMLEKFISIMNEASLVIGHNSDRFDEKELRTRCIANGVLMYPKYRSLDTFKKSKAHFSFPSNKLDYIGKFLNCGRKLDHEGYSLWIKVVEGNDRKALKDMVSYCEQDVILLEDAYSILSPYITHNTNFSTIKDDKNKWSCPECTSNNIYLTGNDVTAAGTIKRKMLCKDCNKQYTISSKNYQTMLKNINNI